MDLWSHYGSIWETHIRAVRRVLGAVLHKQTLDEEGLQTLFCETESIINSTPLIKIFSDPNNLELLTPIHLLLLDTKPVLPPGMFQPEDCYSRRRWRQVQYMAHLVWKSWSREYLSELRERQKWSQRRKNFVVGDIVLIVDDTTPCNCWIIELGLDNPSRRPGHLPHERDNKLLFLSGYSIVYKVPLVAHVQTTLQLLCY